MTRMRAFAYGLLPILAILFLTAGTVRGNDASGYADLGDFQLESGALIRNCRQTYATFGTLNDDKSNVILVPTWLAGTSQELADIGFIGPGRLFDSSKYFIIAVDAFGNGVSSSPSVSAAQSGEAFPAVTIRDMVRAQHLLLTRHMNIRHVYAIAGISMGALQVFQWMVSYPDFMDKAIPIIGSPWQTANDMLIWSAQLAILDQIGACKGSAEAMKALTPLHILLAWTPAYRVANTKPETFAAFLADQQEKLSRYNAANWSLQVKAIMNHDIRKDFGGSQEKTAAAIRAKSLIITSPQDQLVYPGETKRFARLIGARTSELNGECGHFAFLCDRENLKTVVNGFLDRR